MAVARRRVEDLIQTDPVIKKGLQRGIINSRALARYILDVAGVDSTFDAILGIVRRYPMPHGESSNDSQVLRECELSLRDKLAELQVEYHQETMYQIAEFASNLKTLRGGKLKLVVGMGLIRVITDQSALDALRKTLRPRDEIAYTTNLTEISVHLAPASRATVGLVAKITMEFALNDINLEGMMGGASEVNLLVAEPDAPRALEALQRMSKEETTSSQQTGRASKLAPAAQDPLGERGTTRNRDMDAAYSLREIPSEEVLQNSHVNFHRKP